MYTKKNALRNYLMKSFLILLALVGFTEAGLDLIYRNLIYPRMTQILSFDLLSSSSNLSGTIGALGGSFFWMCISSIASLLPGGIGAYLKNIASQEAENQLIGRMMDSVGHMSPLEAQLYIIGIVCVLFMLFVAWLLPYLLAALVFGVLVSKKAAALELERTLQHQAYEHQRNLLLSDVAHDLKTPMTTVAGYASALSLGTVTDPDKQQEYLEAIYQKSMQMNELVVLLFEYVKLDSEGFSLKKENLDLTELLRECVAGLYTDFEAKEMELELDIPEKNIPVSLDRLQFQRALHNLLVNALKHNPDKTKVSISLKKQGDNLVLTISDTGVLIPNDTAAHLFEPFVQGDASRSSKNGSGLGLSITKKIISMHDGTIVLEQPLPSEYTKSFIITIKDTLAVY